MNAIGSGLVEQISVNGVSYALASFSQSVNVAPSTGSLDLTVYDSFYGGLVGSAGVSDANGDTLSYRIGSVSGDYSDQVWAIDANSGALTTNVMRVDESGSRSTFLTVVVSDGLDSTLFNVTITWRTSGEYDEPIGYVFQDGSDDALDREAMLLPDLLQVELLEVPPFYG